MTQPGSTPGQSQALLLERLEERILFNAVPDVSIDADDVALLGEDVNFEIQFDLPDGSDTGFGPFLDIILPRNGADGAAGTDTPDGVGTEAAVSFNVLGVNLTPVLDVIVDSSGTVEHPLLRNPNGTPTLVTGLTPGDRFIVLQLPLGSYEATTAPIVVNGTSNISNLADLGVALPIQVRGGFQYGTDALDNPSVDDPNATLSSFASDTVTPQLITIDKVLNAPENETATGPNYPRSYTINVDIATGQTITDLIVDDPLSNRIVYLGNVIQAGASPDAGSGLITDQPTPNTGPFNDTNLTVEYGSVEGVDGTDITITFDFYVPELDADGNPIIDPVTGQPTQTFNSASATYTWDPIDDRDDPVTEVVEDPADGADQTLTNRSIAVQKSVSIITNTGPDGASPGDVLEYRIEFQISDYFDFENVIIDDILSDGQSLDASFTPQLQILGNGGNPSPLSAFDSANFSAPIQAVAPYGTALQFRVSDELVTRGQVGGVLDGNEGFAPGTTGVIIFHALIDQEFRNPELPPTSVAVDEGDIISNDVSITGTVVVEGGGDGGDVTDSSGTTTQLDGIEATKEVYAINGNTSFGAPVAGPGDLVTFRITVEMPLTRFESLTIIDILPLPIFDAATVTTFNNVVMTSGVPAAGEVAYGPSSQAFFDLYFGDAGNVPTLIDASMTTNNSFQVAFGDFAADPPVATTLDLLVTVEFQDVPIADNLFLTNIVGADLGTTNADDLLEIPGVQIVTSTPELNLTKGVVSTTTGTATFDPAPAGPVSFTAPGTAGAAFSGTITSAGLAANPIDSNLENVDAGDLVKFAIVVENTGSDDAFDLIINDSLPPGFVLPSSGPGLNLQIATGDGTLLSYTDADGNTIAPGSEGDFFFTNGGDGRGVRIVDPADIGGNPQDGAIDGFDDGGASGTNVIIITFDLQVAGGVGIGSTQINEAELVQYGGVNNGSDWTEGVDGPFVDDATVTISTPIIEKNLISTEIVNGTNGLDEAVIGELVTYEIVIRLPEGVSNNLLVTDSFGDLADLAFVSFDSIATSPALSTDLAGGFAAATPVVTENGTVATMFLGNVTNSDTDNSTPETITLTFTAVVLNDAQNQSGSQEVNSSTVSFDVDGETRTDLASSEPITVIEPDIEVNKSVTVDGVPNGTGDAGDPVEYTITIRHSGASDTDAFELTLQDVLPALIDTPVVATVVDTAGIIGSTDVMIVGGVLQFALGGDPLNNEIDFLFDPTREITITVTGVIDGTVTPGTDIPNTASVVWSSMDEDPGQRSTFNPDSTERTGADGPGGALDDYADTSTVVINTLEITSEKSIVATSEDHTGVGAGGIENVAIGEIVRFRLVARVPEATVNPGFLWDLLPDGLTFLDDGTARIAFVGDDPALFTSTAYAPADAFIVGDETTLATITPTFAIPDALLSSDPGDPDADTFTSGVDPYFAVGQVTNNENDANGEFVVIEFNAVVNNIASNQAGTILGNQFQGAELDGTPALTPSNVTQVRIVEPNLNVTKILTVTPNDAGDTFVYRIRVENTAGGDAATAFDLHFTDFLDPNLNLLQVNAVSLPAGGIVTNNSDTGAGNFVDATLDRLDPGGVVVFEVVGSVAVDAAADLTILNTADITYSSLPGATGTVSNPTGSMLPTDGSGVPGDVNGERTGDDGPGGALNDYADTDAIAFELATPTVEKFVDLTQYAVGEIVSFDLRITLNEGTTLGLNVTDNLPVGMELVSYTLITDAADSNGLLLGDFSGNLSVVSDNLPITGSGSDLVIDFGDTLTLADNRGTNNSFLVRVEARVLNESGNQDGTELTNVAELRYTDPDDSSVDLLTDEVVVEVIEPELTLDKQITSLSQDPPDAGDTIQYTIVIQHDPSTSSSDAFDVVFTDLAATNTLITGIVSVVATGFGTTTVPTAEITGGGTGIRLSDLPGSGEFDLPLGATITLVYEVTIQDTVVPGELLENDADIAWTSVDGPVNSGDLRGERDGSSAPDEGGLNDYFDDASADVTTAEPDIAKAVVSTTVPNTSGVDLVIGEQVTFYVTITLAEGTYPSPFVVTDNLPFAPGVLELVSATFRDDLSDSGLQFDSFTLLTSDSNTDSYVDQAEFSFVNLVNPGTVGTNNNQMVFEIVAVVVDDPANADGDNLTNTATLTYDGFTDSATADVDIVEPELVIDKVSDVSTGLAGDLVTYTLTVQHSGTSTADAFDVVIGDELLEGLGLDDKLDLLVGSVTTSAGTVTIGNSTGDTTIQVQIDEVALGEIVTVTFQAYLNANIDPTGDVVTNTATVDFDSLPGAGGRTGEDSDDATVTTGQAEIGFDKSIVATSEIVTASGQYDPAIEDVAIGEVVTYRIVVDLAPGQYNNPLQITDQLPDFLGLINPLTDARIVSIGAGIVFDSVDDLVFDDTNGDGFDDNIMASINVVSVALPGTDPADNQIVFEIDARVLNVAGNQATGTPLTNTANLVFGTFTGTDSVDVEVVEPELTLDKALVSQSDPTLDAGDTVTYSITIENIGTAAAFNTIFADIAPPGTSITSIDSLVTSGFVVPPTAEITGGGTGIRLNGTSPGEFNMPVGATLTLTYTVTLEDSVEHLDVLTNDANLNWTSLSGDDNPGLPEGERDGSGGVNDYVQSDSVTVDVAGNLEIEKTTVNGTEFAIGDTVEYALTVSMFEGTTTGLIVTDDIPDNFDVNTGSVQIIAPPNFTFLTPPVITFDGDVLTIELGDVVNSGDNNAANDSFVIRYDAVVLNDPANNDGDVKPNTADAESTNGLTDDAMHEVNIVEPVLSIEKSISDDTPHLGDVVTYTFVVQHTGDSTTDAYDLRILDMLPPEVDLRLLSINVIAPPGSVVTDNSTGNTIDISINQLLLGDEVTVTFRAEVTSDIDAYGDTFDNTVNLDWDSQPGENPEEREDMTEDNVPATIFGPDLVLDKSTTETEIELGVPFEYAISVTNKTGPFADVATNARVVDRLPPGLQFVGSDSPYFVSYNPQNRAVVWLIPTLAVGETVDLTLEVQLAGPVPPVETLVNVAAVTHDDVDPTPLDNIDSVPLPISVDVTPDLTVTKDDGLTRVSPGQQVTYTIVVTNVGPQTATGIRVTDEFPAEVLNFISASHGGSYNSNTGIVTWNIPRLIGEGGKISLTLTGTVKVIVDDPTISNFTNTVSVTDDGRLGPDPTPENNFDSDTDNIFFYGYDSFNDFREHREMPRTFDRFSVLQPVETYISGIADPGTGLFMAVRDETGEMVGWRSTMTDAGGNYLANFQGVFIGGDTADIHAKQTFAGYNRSDFAGYNLRRYYEPAPHSNIYPSELGSVRSVFRQAPSEVLTSLHAVNTTPLRLTDWNLAPYQLRVSSF